MSICRIKLTNEALVGVRLIKFTYLVRFDIQLLLGFQLGLHFQDI